MTTETQEERSGGGLYWTAKVYDDKTGEFFRLKAIQDTIYVYPVDEEFGLGTFMRFVEFVKENVDPNATVEPADTAQRA